MQFLVQVNEYGVPVTDAGFKIIDAVNYQNWYNGNNPGQSYVARTTLNGGKSDNIVGNLYGIESMKESIPVGTIEFVEKYLKRNFGIWHVKPINIPLELTDNYFVRREIWWDVSTKKIKQTIQSGAYQRLFIKSNTQCKKYTSIVGRLELEQIPEDNYMVSTLIDIVAEWRVFVYRQNIVDARLYVGSWNDMFDKEFILKAVKQYKNCPTAYCIDVALLKNGAMAVIEVHNFISCGLYGFEDYTVLPQMLYSAYKYETEHR